MERGREHASPGGGIGPVEAADDTTLLPESGDRLLSGGDPRPSEWWHRLTPGRHRPLSWAAAAALLAVAGGYALANRPAPPAPVPVPLPSLVTTFSYKEIQHIQQPTRAVPDTFRVLAEVAVTPDTRGPVTVVSVRNGYPTLTTTTLPRTPFTVRPGESRRLVMLVRVHDCSRTPKDAESPFTNVTLRNTRAMQTRSEIFGDRYARALSATLHSLCPTVVRQATRPSPRSAS